MNDDAQFRIICDACMCDVVIVASSDEARDSASRILLLQCHGTEELVYRASLPNSAVLVWSMIRDRFISRSQLHDMEESAVKSMLRYISILRLSNRVLRAQGASPTYLPTEDLDQVIDALLLFRNPNQETTG